MPIVRMSYLDLSPEQRRAGAKVVKERLRASLSNPNLTPEQLQQLQGQLQKIELWEKGALERPSLTNSPLVEKIDPQFVQKLNDLCAPK
jgi:hypothetical protein